MKKEKISDKKIRLEITIDCEKQELSELITEPHKLRLWLANQVAKTPKGFRLQIDYPLYSFTNEVTYVTKQKDLIEFRWNSEYVMDTSLVVWKILEDPLRLSIEEIGDFDGSRWSDPQSIHLDIWETAAMRLKRVLEDRN